MESARFIDSRTVSVNNSGMDLDELSPKAPGDPLKALTRQDLDPLSVEELAERIEILKAEIARVEAKLSRAKSHRAIAEDLFKR